MFKQRLEQYGVSPFMSTVHSTRLKDRLLAEIPEIETHESGRDTVLTFKKDIGPVSSKAFKLSDAIVLSKAASILRRLMLGHETSFDGRFKEDCIER
ncbi:hypothetical protein DPMN_149584 [Dreissena polymorpha]|uniref:Uncharacterized protein n=1 Tax=Dreissena polymorpha TaxID=45954 RepID=A0A9D4FG91_DREPO|nr:hypothetical protein DPMN_149584 [Dreissena polymorpha]